MKNIPKKIYLNLGLDDETAEDFKDLVGVSWADEKVNSSDIEYVLKELDSIPYVIPKEKKIWQIVEDMKKHFNFNDEFTNVIDELCKHCYIQGVKTN